VPAEVTLVLQPLDRRLTVPRGAPLRDVLFPLGVEFPCGGRGRCRGCRVRVLAGELPVTPEDQRLLGPERLAQGWRLACRARADTDLTLELAQWETPILSDETPVAFTPRPGRGAAVDVGTTTVVAQLLDLATGHVLGVRSALNAQARHGADIMSRLEFALAEPGRAELTRLIREQIGALLADLLAAAPSRGPLLDVVLVGNTVMHHLFSGLPVAPLAHYPFEPVDPGLQEFRGAALGWDFAGAARVSFLPCPGGFVGSDILAGILATGLDRSERPAMLVDLGTNGEIVVGNRTRLVCASTAAGPAFEGARLAMGMRAATGAISAVSLGDGAWQVTVLGGAEPRGICGSGLVDAVACGLETGRILPSGRLVGGPTLPLAGPVELTQADLRELQLAKGAIAAGIHLLLERLGLQPADLARVWLAGAFGNYISRASARRIGLLPFPVEQVEPAGNTALRGAKQVLCGAHGLDRNFADLRARLEHVPLKDDPRFQEAFVAAMGFPAPGHE
jgi:uncharacterized 2Fe-2S/4Fe-4S cluster protein (DUF4445 family)